MSEPNEDDYRESEDEDFNPDNGEVDQSSDSEDEKEIAKYKDFEGAGLIKTRAQRQLEEQQEKEYDIANKVNSSLDVDSLWQSMNQKNPPHREKILEEEYVVVKRRYEFAGKVTVEEKKVPKSSAEGRAYLKEEEQEQLDAKKALLDEVEDLKEDLKDWSNEKSTENPKESSQNLSLKRPADPLKRRGPPKKKKSSLMAELEAGKAKKMNTLEKSRLDWIGFVDQEGIKDDLTHFNKAGFLHRQDFLSRVERNLDEKYKEGQKKC